MNFVCDRCKQKYHVADEKLRGRAVTRFRCKKCEHVIELDLAASEAAAESPTMTAPTVTAPTVAARTTPRPVGTAPVSRPRSATMVGGAAPRPPVRARAATVTGATVSAAMGSAARPLSRSPSERSTSAILNAAENGWYAGIRDLPVGPLTRKELLAKVQSGDVSADTLVWREGLDDWRPLRNVAELGDMLRAGAQKLSGDLIEEMGKRPVPPRSARVVPISTARGGSSRPAVVDDDEEATRVSSLDPAIAAMAARALTRAKEEPVDESEDATLVARQRAAAAAAIAPAALSSDELAHGPTIGSVPPAHEPHRIPVSPSSRPPAPQPPTPSARPAPSAPPTPSRPAAATDFGLDELPENLFAAAAKPDSLPPAPNAPSLNLSGRPDGAVALTAPSLSPLGPPLVAPPQPAPLSMPVPAQQPSRGGLSMPVIVLIGGVLVSGIGMGIYIGRQNTPQVAAPAPVRVATNTVPSAPPAPAVGEALVLPPPTVVATAAPAAPETPETPETPEVTPEHVNPSGSHNRPHNNSANARSPHNAQPVLTAEQRAALRELGAQPATSAGGPVGNTQLRTSQPSSASPEHSGESNSARANRAIRIFQDSRVANNCWQQVLRQNPALRSGAVSIMFTVTNAGRFTNIEVTNSPDARFTQCIRSRSGGIAPLGGGGEVNAQVSVTLTAN